MAFGQPLPPPDLFGLGVEPKVRLRLRGQQDRRVCGAPCANQRIAGVELIGRATGAPVAFEVACRGLLAARC
jgi:hypothetical protein